MHDVTIDPDRVLGHLYELREIGRYKTGVHRPTLSAEDMQARRWFVEKLEAIGHAAEIDGIANVIGTAPGDGPMLLAGSHLESQNYAGWLDGALGMVYALEAATVASTMPQLSGKGVDVIACADEEGHFGSLLGSRSFIGEISEADIDSAANRTTGVPLRNALREVGLEGRPRRTIDPERYLGFLEAHIEQGDWLESGDLDIGIVTSIVSIATYRLRFEGVQNHAGTTRMAIRKDAGVAARRFLHNLEEAFAHHAGPRTVWTVGRMELHPGATSVIPGRADVWFQFRDGDPDKLEELHALLVALAEEANQAEPCKVELETLSRSVPAAMDEVVQAALERAAEAVTPGRHVRMPSGAGHDAQVLARRIPAGMLFVPSIGGISHHPDENTSDEHIALGAHVYARAAIDLLAGV